MCFWMFWFRYFVFFLHFFFQNCTYISTNFNNRIISLLKISTTNTQSHEIKTHTPTNQMNHYTTTTKKHTKKSSYCCEEMDWVRFHLLGGRRRASSTTPRSWPGCPRSGATRANRCTRRATRSPRAEVAGPGGAPALRTSTRPRRIWVSVLTIVTQNWW